MSKHPENPEGPPSPDSMLLPEFLDSLDWLTSEKREFFKQQLIYPAVSETLGKAWDLIDLGDDDSKNQAKALVETLWDMIKDSRNQ